MRHRFCGLALAWAALLVAAPAVLAQEELPEGVTQEMIAEGESLFKGAGVCAVCHAQNAEGMPNLGADLTDDEWQHSDGSLEGILHSITKGVTADKSSTGSVMPPKGGSGLSDSQLEAVAAYVWSLRRE
jgi:mono/diheme cytochrome c family protein